MGTAQRMADVRDAVKSCRAWQPKGLEVKLCRWMSYFDRAGGFMPQWFITVLSLCSWHREGLAETCAELAHVCCQRPSC
jgi:hypothetical protein